MTIPTVPTDSTKKFFFIIGVIMMIYSCYKASNIYVDFTANGRTIDSLVTIRKAVAIKYREVSEAIPLWIADRNRMVDSMSRVYHRPKNEIFEQYFKFATGDSIMMGYKKTYMDEIKALTIPINKLGAYREFRKRLFKEQLAVITITFILGFILTVYGFRSWRNEEIIKDKILKRQLDLLNLEYEQKLNPKISDPTRYNRK
ncbi:hypothetical protein [Pedobacter miscanthi]|uniref:hypothetical protein n=1 Tax=Pedobacter miscanthi TaxID=2259170 RepID=UPI00293114CD|nr:hypothetical protein [Pedobacter miscanthi]